MSPQNIKGDDPFTPVGVEIDCEPVALDIKVQEQLGKVFRAYCDDLIRQPVPEKFVVLLARLEAKQRGKK